MSKRRHLLWDTDTKSYVIVDDLSDLLATVNLPVSISLKNIAYIGQQFVQQQK